MVSIIQSLSQSVQNIVRFSKKEIVPDILLSAVRGESFSPTFQHILQARQTFAQITFLVYLSISH